MGTPPGFLPEKKSGGLLGGWDPTGLGELKRDLQAAGLEARDLSRQGLALATANKQLLTEIRDLLREERDYLRCLTDQFEDLHRKIGDPKEKPSS